MAHSTDERNSEPTVEILVLESVLQYAREELNPLIQVPMLKHEEHSSVVIPEQIENRVENWLRKKLLTTGMTGWE